MFATPGPGGLLLHFAQPAPPPARPLRVLVVDDNQDAAQALAVFLEMTGHEVRVAHDGPEGLAAARRFLPDAIILDIGMPGLNGWEVARLLRQEPGLRGVLLVALTGYAGEQYRQLCVEAGFDHYLVKPSDAQEVRRLIEAERGPGP
jgi:CheY-like chemotaxis protein